MEQKIKAGELTPEQLRKGNLIKGVYYTEGFDDDDNEPKESICEFLGYDPWDDRYWVHSKGIADEFDRFEPIPLTEKWLVRMGFVKCNDTDSYYQIKAIGSLLIIYVNHKFNTCEISISGLGARVKYLKHIHQLQNLYFALTGSELTLNDK